MVECKRCKARTANAVPDHYCQACARFLEGQSEVRRNLDSATMVINQILKSIAMIIAANNQPELTRWFADTLSEQATLYALEQSKNKMTRDELIYFNRLVQYTNQLMAAYEQTLDLQKTIAKQPAPESTESTFDLFEAEESAMDQPNQQAWDWNPDDERDWADDYEPPAW